MPERGHPHAVASTALDQALEEARLRRRLPDPQLRRLIRERVGLTQHDLARALGIDPASVSRYESGRRMPRGGLLQRYAALLDRLIQEAGGAS